MLKKKINIIIEINIISKLNIIIKKPIDVILYK